MSVATPFSSQLAPTLVIVEGGQSRSVIIDKSPYTVGRRPGNDLVIGDARVSRDHAIITADNGAYWLADQNSKHGTYVNGEKIERHRLQSNDRLEFGARDGFHVIFNPSQSDQTTTPASEELLSHISGLSNASDLEKLTLLLEAARKLNTTRVLEDVLLTLLDLTLRLTGAERAYVFLRERDGKLRMAAGRDARGAPLADDSTISRSILQEAADSGCEFLLTDTSHHSSYSARQSIVAFDLRTVICIPLCKTQVKERLPNVTMMGVPRAQEVRGVLYLDSRFASRDISAVSHDVLRAIATEAAALVENAYLVQAEENARLYEKELAIAASIQQNLMPVSIPDVPFARVRARSVACKEIGGDFFDVIRTDAGLAMVVADVAGKGVSAALLASTLQGMVYSHLTARMPLPDIATAVNRYLCQRQLESKYATMILTLISADGHLEFVNCGHLEPLCVTGDSVVRLQTPNLPVGLLPEATYESAHHHLNPGDRLLLYSDGVTEAANAADEFFGDARLEAAARGASALDEIFAQVARFTSGVAMSDDCTVLELQFRSDSVTDTSGGI